MHMVTEVSDRINNSSLQSKKLAYRAKKPFPANPGTLQGILNLPKMGGNAMPAN